MTTKGYYIKRLNLISSYGTIRLIIEEAFHDEELSAEDYAEVYEYGTELWKSLEANDVEELKRREFECCSSYYY